MAPSGSSKNTRLKTLRHYSGSNGGTKVTSKRRFKHDIIDGINIYSFQSELELEYFCNIEELLPQKIKQFQGFDETDDSVNLVKNHFDDFVKNFIENTAKTVQPSNDGLERVLESHVWTADKQASTILVSDDENSLNATYSFKNVDPRGTIDDSSAQIVDKMEVISTDDSDSDDDDDDDDVAMTSDPKAPFPQPRGDCVCLNCGKTVKPRENGRVTSGSNKGRGLDDVSIITDAGDVIMAIYEDVQAHSEKVKVQPEQVPTHPEEMPMPTRPKGATFQPEDMPMSMKPKGSTVQLEEGPMPTLPIGAPVKFEDVMMPTQPAGVSVELEFSTHPEDVSVQPDDVPSHPSELSIHLEEQSASQIREPIGTTSDESHLTTSLKLDGVSNLTDQTGSSSSFPSHVSASQKPSGYGIKMPAIAPGTIRLILPEIGKTVTLKFGGVKSNTLSLRTKPLTHTSHVMIPLNKMNQITVPPESQEEKRVTRTQPINEALGRFQVRNSCDAKSDVLAPGNRLQEGLAIQSKMKQDGISHVESLKESSHSTSDLGKVTSLSNEVHDPAMVMPPTSDFIPSVGSLTITGPPSSQPLVVDCAARSVVQDLVDFVCRKECFPVSYPYDEMKIEVPCLTLPCRKLRCGMGCICISIAKKNVRRARCKSAACIFGCICLSQGVATSSNQHVKTRPNMKKALVNWPRGKKLLAVQPKPDTGGFGSTSQPPSYGFPLPVKMFGNRRACGVAGNSGSKEYSRESHSVPDPDSIRLDSGFGSMSQPPHTDLQLPSKGLCFQKPVGNAASQVSCRDSAKGLSVSVTQPRRISGREQISIPERALICLTPGWGYVPLEKISPKVVVHSPFKPGTTESFLHIRLATEWLNSNLQAIFNTTTDLRWVVANESMIEKKQIHRLSINVLKSLNCTISKTGAISETRKNT